MNNISKEEKYKALVIGATGLVGKQVVNLLLNDESIESVRVFVRRATGIRHSKLDERIVNFREMGEWKDLVTGDILFSSLGTTLKDAGSKDKQYEVDYTYNYNFAHCARQNGVERFVLVSSVGADASSGIFYTRIKGELDEAVSRMGFRRTVILRPGPLYGNRERKRWMEEVSVPLIRVITKIGFVKYRPISDTQVARAMIKSALDSPDGQIVLEGKNLFRVSE